VGPLIVFQATKSSRFSRPDSSRVRIISMDTSLFRESLTNAIRYWEKMRLVYNGVLIAVVGVCFAWTYSTAKAQISVNLFLLFVLLAVLANVAYCGAYIVDVVVQMSGFRERWAKYRWILFSIGVLFAAIIARFWSLGIFT
jgi:hypothetical protein